MATKSKGKAPAIVSEWDKALANMASTVFSGVGSITSAVVSLDDCYTAMRKLAADDTDRISELDTAWRIDHVVAAIGAAKAIDMAAAKKEYTRLAAMSKKERTAVKIGNRNAQQFFGASSTFLTNTKERTGFAVKANAARGRTRAKVETVEANAALFVTREDAVRFFRADAAALAKAVESNAALFALKNVKAKVAPYLTAINAFVAAINKIAE